MAAPAGDNEQCRIFAAGWRNLLFSAAGAASAAAGAVGGIGAADALDAPLFGLVNVADDQPQNGADEKYQNKVDHGLTSRRAAFCPL